MAYLTCPWCLTPQQVGDESNEYRCFNCSGEIRIYSCPNCSFIQTISKRWRAFICGNCEATIDLPFQFTYSPEARASRVQGTGKSWPPL